MCLINRAILFGAMLSLPVSAATAGVANAAPETPDPVIHVVHPGDNLGRLSELYGISIGALALANGLSSSVIHLGQHLVVPSSDWPVNPESKGRDPSQSIIYVVMRGDYLGRVAQEYGTTVEAIMNASNLSSPLVITDQFLKIPAISGYDNGSVAAMAVEETAAESLDEIAEVGDEVTELEVRMRQELDNANYPYAFTESLAEITRVHQDTVAGVTAAPVDVVVEYWTYVSQKRYGDAWVLLSDGFKARAHNNVFKDYASNYRDMSLCSAKAENVEVVSHGSSQTVVDADVTYRTGADCTILEFNLTLTMQSLQASGEWKIDKVAVTQSVDEYVPESDPSNGELKWIDVDIGAQRVYAMVGNRRAREFVASTGIARYPTVTGQFQVWVKLRKDDMRGVDLGVPWYLPDVPYVMYFFSDYGIHGTYWHDKFGTPMSHGCVNLTVEDAEWLYNFSQVGTVVNVHH